MLRYSAIALVLGTALLVGGCSRSGNKLVSVSGIVEVDGKPLPDGQIAFSSNPGSVPDIVVIKNGRFEGQVHPGKQRVEILALRGTGKKDTMYPDVEQKVNYIPGRYNTNSTLTAEVTSSGLNPSRFTVQTR